MNSSMSQVSKSVFFRNKIGASRRFWVQEARHSENIFAEMCYLYRKTRDLRLCVCLFVSFVWFSFFTYRFIYRYIIFALTFISSSYCLVVLSQARRHRAEALHFFARHYGIRVFRSFLSVQHFLSLSTRIELLLLLPKTSTVRSIHPTPRGSGWGWKGVCRKRVEHDSATTTDCVK